MKIFLKCFDNPTLCTLLAPCPACWFLNLPLSCALKLWLVLPTLPGACEKLNSPYISNLSASSESKGCCLGFCQSFQSLFARLPEPGTPLCRPPPFPFCASVICHTSLTFPSLTGPVYLVCMLTATCSPTRLLLDAPFQTGRFLSSSAVL